MTTEVIPIPLGGLFGYGANCYLVKTNKGTILIDTGVSPKRSILERKLESAGCRPGNLQLIIITHEHGDHIGNCAYLQRRYQTQIAIHRAGADLLERGNKEISLINRMILGLISWIAGIGEIEHFKPDIFLDEGDDLARYGLEAHVLHLPGHSNGSIGILTTDGDLFCGDLFVNVGKPAKHSIVTDAAAFDASIERLKRLGVRTVYPGHGKPFQMEQLINIGSNQKGTGTIR